jgi:hypothetical protein
MTRSERGFTELITHTERGGDTNLTTAIHGSAKLVAYEYRGPVVLLEDFLREVERILTELGVL